MTSRKLNVNQLIQAASNVLDLLEEVDEFPGLYAGPILQNAIRRYELFWLPLAAKQGKESRHLAAPLDIAWVWHVHMLSPHSYEQDCLNVVSQVIDHAPMNRYQRQEGLQRARYLWQTSYPVEPFEVDLTKPAPTYLPYKSKIRHDLETASHHQSKFHHQVSLPHYADRKFLAKAVDRYEHHLKLKHRNPHIPMVPCNDVDLIWRAHLQHPLNYKHVTTNMFGTMVHRDDSEGSVSRGFTLLDSEMSTRAVWEEAGLQFDKPGAMYRGDPPPRRLPGPDGPSVELGRLEYQLIILRVEVLNVDFYKTFFVRLFDPSGNLILSQAVKRDSGVDLMNPQCTIDNEEKHWITVSLYQKALLGEKAIGSSQTSMLSHLDSLDVNGQAPTNPWIIDVPFSRSQSFVRLTVKLTPPVVESYRFTIRHFSFFTKYDHLSVVLKFPQSMLSPSDFKKPSLPCEAAVNTLIDFRGREAFKCRVVHSTAAVLSAVEVINLLDDTVATAYTINSAVLPEIESVEGEERCVPLNQEEGERAILIRGRKDWGICIGKFQEGKLFKRSAGQVEIAFFSLHGTKGWCEVRKCKEGLYLIYFDSSNCLHIDFKKGILMLPPAAHYIPEMIALAFSIPILHLLCKPYTPSPFKKSSPSSHTKAKSDKVTPMLIAAGYRSTSVPTNVYLGIETGRPFAEHASHDFDSEPRSHCTETSQSTGARDTKEAYLPNAYNGGSSDSSRSSSLSWRGSGGYGDGGYGDGDVGGGHGSFGGGGGGWLGGGGGHDGDWCGGGGGVSGGSGGGDWGGGSGGGGGGGWGGGSGGDSGGGGGGGCGSGGGGGDGGGF